MIVSGILLTAAGVALGAFLVTAALSPLETLSWWAGWTEDELEDDENGYDDAPLQPDESIAAYIVYLSGVASISGQYLLPREKSFIRGLRKELPAVAVIADVFPYSPAGLPLLAAPRLFDRLWRRVQTVKIQGKRSLLAFLINIRNIFQVMVAADHRYGPIFGQGAGNAIGGALLKAGYQPGSRAPVYIIGYSGGAQVAVNAAPFLQAKLSCPISVISIGGVMASDPGLSVISTLHHIRGDGDRVEKTGALLFAERWRIFATSPWNMARRENRIKIHKIKNMIHAGPRGYFGLVPINGTPNNIRTQTIVRDIIVDNDFTTN
ncbi:MAG: hypothetical protein AAGD92_06485 [Pseudomonadota bacterium]